MSNHQFLTKGKHVPVYGWTNGVPIEPDAIQQLHNVASMPFVHHHVAVMPDVHVGIGATVGSVIPTYGAIIPASVGVDIGCGMCAVQLSLKGSQLPDSLKEVRGRLEDWIPVGQASHKGAPELSKQSFAKLDELYQGIISKAPKIEPKTHPVYQLGTLGGGNHFIELCIDTEDNVWVMLHSGSRGIGNRIGTHFISKAQEEMRRNFHELPDKDLAYLVEGSEGFVDYMVAVGWAQEYARLNREVMLKTVLRTLETLLPPFSIINSAVNCHHNYVEKEHHYGKNVYVTRKGAVRARKGELGIIPGSMGAKSFIVEGLGSEESFCSCSHGAGRVMSRTRASKELTLEDHERDTAGVECRKDVGVLDESPKAYKDIDAVMAAQSDLVRIVATLKQVMCIKG